MIRNYKMSQVARKFVLANKIVGFPKLTDFKIVEETLPQLNDGEILAKAEFWTVDPYLRGRSVDFMQIGDPMLSGQIAKVIESRCSEFPTGTNVVTYFGWRDYTVYRPVPNGPRTRFTIYALPDMKGLPLSLGLGACGMPGMTAYLSLSELVKPKEGETLVVSAAAGAVGSLVGQIGKINGCKVIGFAGSDDKIDWLKNDLGFDLAFNYKGADLHKILKEHAPQGVDCYFDSVGGEMAYHVMENMNPFGRIAQCGNISSYNAVPEEGKLIIEPFNYKGFRGKNMSLLGFNVGRWGESPLYFNGILQIRDWILEGKLKARETVSEGFESIPQAFIEMLQGKNFGKQIITA